MTMSKTEAWFQTASDSTVTVRFSKDEDAPPRFHVGYWSIRGLCAPLRMMLCAARADFVCHMYDIQEDSDAKAGWVTGYFKEKAENLLQYNPFMNLPYVADQQEKLVVTQSNACLQYLGDQLGMMGQTAAEHTFCVQLLCELYDLRDAMVKHAYGNPADTAEAAVQTAQKHFAKFDKHLETKDNKCFLIGDSFTAPDFHLFEMIDQFDQLCKTNEFEDCLAEYPHVRAFYTAFAQLEENQFYLHSIFHKGLPFNNFIAQFGSTLAAAPAVHEQGQSATPWRKLGAVTLCLSESVEKS